MVIDHISTYQTVYSLLVLCPNQLLFSVKVRSLNNLWSKGRLSIIRGSTLLIGTPKVWTWEWRLGENNPPSEDISSNCLRSVLLNCVGTYISYI